MVRTFLFTDLEGSTRLWEREPQAMERWLARHDALLTETIQTNRGHVFKHTGDGFCAVFEGAFDAVRAALRIQVTLAASSAEQIGPLRARIALHTGPAQERGGDFFGPTLNRCARLLSAGHGGQVLLTAVTAAILSEGEMAGQGMALVDLGQHRLRDLHQPQGIRQLAAPGLERSFPPLRSLDAFVHNLPVQRSSFVGREHEQEALRELVKANRLVTVTGVGGCGKTRLALEVAAAEVDRFSDGVFFADLSTLVEPDLVVSTVAAALRVPPGPGTTEERLRDFLSGRCTLILVDNCEHLLEGCAVALDHLLASCPSLSVLATSREPLALDGERVWRVRSLGLPEGESVDEIGRSEAVRLFVDRAAAVRPGFAVTAHNVGDVAEICHRLDGIPLALELAAARVAHMAPREIVQRLSHRFRLLAMGRRGVQRQQTLQAVLDWSYDLLAEPERVLLQRLSVFSGGWTLESAQAVCGGDDLDPEHIVDVLGSLVSRSLVDAEDRPGHTRYRLLETVRLYVQEKIVASGGAAAARTAHAEWYLRRAETSADGRPRLRLWFQYHSPDLVPDLDNIRQAADWWLTQERHDLVVRIASGAAMAFLSQGRLDEPDEWIKIALGHDAALPNALRAWVHATRAQVTEARGDFFAANEQARLAIALAIDPADAGSAYSLLVANFTWIDPDEAERLLVRASEWTAFLGPAAEDYLLDARGCVALARFDYEGAASLFARMQRGGMFGERLLELAVAHMMSGDLAAAARVLEEDDADTTAWGNALGWLSYYAPFLRSVLVARGGDLASARALLLDALALVRRWKFPLGVADCVVGCAVIAFHAGHFERAAELLAAVQGATGGGLRSPMSMCIYRGYVRAVRNAIGRDAMVRVRHAGGALTLEAALVRELPGSGR